MPERRNKISRFLQRVKRSTSGFDPSLDPKGWGRKVALLGIEAQILYDTGAEKRRHVARGVAKVTDNALEWGDGPLARWFEQMDGVVLGLGVNAASMALKTPIEVIAAVLDALPEEMWLVLQESLERRERGEAAFGWDDIVNVGDAIVAAGDDEAAEEDTTVDLAERRRVREALTRANEGLGDLRARMSVGRAGRLPVFRATPATAGVGAGEHDISTDPTDDLRDERAPAEVNPVTSDAGVEEPPSDPADGAQ